RETHTLHLVASTGDLIEPRTLETIGTNLYESLFPDELKELWRKRIRGNVKSIQIVSDEPWIPWELIRPTYREEDGSIQEDGFLCEDYLVGRWLAGSPPPVELRLKQGTYIIPKDSNLLYAHMEAEVLKCLGVNIYPTPPSLQHVRMLFSAGGYDLIHFACHANFEPDRHEQSTILLENQEKLMAREIVGRQCNFGFLHHPLVFVNACRSARSDLSFLAGIGSWAERFVQAKSSAFIGCAWSVDDDAAYRFAEEFYQQLKVGHSLGESVRKARIAAKSIPGSTSWLSYVLYGDPLARIMVAKSVA
ncbi:MAG: CHAT domain-containing protein, partial [Candidatus Contendobacter sp.]|nr:CHAT domain-containing protein [Candidatus Contendobacter sp.]MDG4556670.1 CHAT domain-containing protein [Candidatus Contendobacter sp.]